MVLVQAKLGPKHFTPPPSPRSPFANLPASQAAAGQPRALPPRPSRGRAGDAGAAAGRVAAAGIGPPWGSREGGVAAPTRTRCTAEQPAAAVVPGGPGAPPRVEAMQGKYPVGFFAVVVSALEGKDCKESVRAIAESVDLSEEQLTSLISGMYTLLREALRLPISTFKQEVFKEDLQELRIPEEFIMDFASVVFGNRRPVVEATTMKQGNKLPSVNDIKWRVDVAISTSSLARALQPSILMLLKLSDGTAHRFEVPVVKFQELRYNVALILKEMNDLEKRSILKIQD
uniref:COMM domain-containing protein 5 n=1 Tax=Chelonoidis abingdonii TaxID=106734 RepID=A0A8C0IX29_CHEAB